MWPPGSRPSSHRETRGPSTCEKCKWAETNDTKRQGLSQGQAPHRGSRQPMDRYSPAVPRMALFTSRLPRGSDAGPRSSEKLLLKNQRHVPDKQFKQNTEYFNFKHCLARIKVRVYGPGAGTASPEGGGHRCSSPCLPVVNDLSAEEVSYLPCIVHAPCSPRRAEIHFHEESKFSFMARI